MSLSRQRILYAAVLLSIVGWVVTGCQPESATPPASSEEASKTVVLPYAIDLEGVNELITQPTTIHVALNYFALFLPLLEEQADYQDGPPTFTPRLAESFEYSEDRLTLTFKLRQNVQWSDGVPVTAEDVRWTWQAQTHPDMGWAFAPQKARISDVEVVDPHTVRFHFTEAYSTQMLDVNQGVILPKHAWSQLPFEEWRGNTQWFVDHLVVSGPFTLESWTPQERYVLRRNDNYFEPGLPKVDRIVFELTPDRANQINQLRAGKGDFVEFVQYSDAATIEEHPDLYLIGYTPRFYFFISWNVSQPPFAQREVRQALTLAIDRQAIVEANFYGYGEVSWSPFPPDHWALNRQLEPWPYDPGQAKEMLAAQGWQDTDGDGILDRDGKPFRFELLTNSENDLRRDILVMVQEQLRQVGIDVVPRTMEFNAMIGPLTEGKFDAVISGLGIGTDLDMTPNFHTKGITQGFNWGRFSNPEMDALIEEIGVQQEQLPAKPLYERLQALLHEEQPVTFLYAAQRLTAANRRLQEIEPNALSSFMNMRNWELADTN